MSFKFVFLHKKSGIIEEYARAMENAVPDLEVSFSSEREQQLSDLIEARGCYGTLEKELIASAKKLEWLAAPQAGPPRGYYFSELINSSIQVTNFRGIFNDHISSHIMAFVLCFSRGMHIFFPDQFQQKWTASGENSPAIHLPESTTVIVGIGGIGAATAQHCKHFGMEVIGVDPRVSSKPEGVDQLYEPKELDNLLPEADFIIVTAPQTPSMEGLFDKSMFDKMKDSAIFINIGRGSNVVLSDLNEALRNNSISGAALDVFEIEPLPQDHPLWTAPNFLMTPHMAAAGPYLTERRIKLMVENCRRFSNNEPLLNVVDKRNWF